MREEEGWSPAVPRLGLGGVVGGRRRQTDTSRLVLGETWVAETELHRSLLGRRVGTPPLSLVADGSCSITPSSRTQLHPRSLRPSRKSPLLVRPPPGVWSTSFPLLHPFSPVSPTGTRTVTVVLGLQTPTILLYHDKSMSLSFS